MPDLLHDSRTERRFTRSRHFEDMAKDAALKQSTFLQEQIAYYLTNVFKDDRVYQLRCESRLEADRVYTIRKGSAVLTVSAVFGLNTTYDEIPPRKFYTFTVTARHHNEVLDETGRISDFVEWSFRVVGALVLGLILSLVLLLFGGNVGPHIFAVFTFGAAVGGFIGQHVGHRIYASTEKRLDAQGEITAVETEWAMLTETLAMLFDQTGLEANA